MRDEEGGAEGVEFRTYKYMLDRKGEIKTTMKTVEGHELSEKVGVSEASLTYALPGENNFVIP